MTDSTTPANALPASQPKSGEQRWIDAVNKQSWNDASQIVHLEGFLRDEGLFDKFAAYAERAAAEEAVDERVNLLEDLGFEFNEDSDQLGMWVWRAPTDACDVSFATRQQAIDSAWTDVVTQTMAINEMGEADWTVLSQSNQIALVQETLAGYVEPDAPRA